MAGFNFINESALRRIVREMLQEGDWGSGAGGDTREKHGDIEMQELTGSFRKQGINLPGSGGGPAKYSQKYFDDLAKKHGGTADQYKKQVEKKYGGTK